MSVIDVHSHFFTGDYLAALQRAGIYDVDGFPMPTWSAEAALAAMDSHAIDAVVLSISAPGLSFVTNKDATTLARSVNQQAAEIVKAHPSRFGAFALLPMPDVKASLAELAYAMDTLHLDGVGLYTNYAGSYLGDPKFEPLFEELHRRNVTVFVHPVVPVGFANINAGFPGPMLEYPFDTTRTIVSLLASRMLEKHPVPLIVSHGGGAFPYLISRILPILGIMARDPKRAETARAAIPSIYWDLTAATSAGQLAAMRSVLAPANILLGFDFPFMPNESVPPALRDFRAFPGFTATDRMAIEGGSAERLFPGLATRLTTRLKR